MAWDIRPRTSRLRLPPITGPAMALIDVANTVMPRMMIEAANSRAAVVCGVISP
ncbi:Uncharacterised protein [Bordetella pertussis]|nr:Uncharacterised protein [Bordetella pertussis]CPL76688.1 Uncharacterised protein [Bordetella pertussis]CPN60683.1 Uncharacterised protein [Bordetella pertussis]